MSTGLTRLALSLSSYPEIGSFCALGKPKNYSMHEIDNYQEYIVNMPRKNRRNHTKSKSRNSFNQLDTVRVHIRSYVEATLSAGSATISVSPALCAQSAQYADAFQLYKVTKLRFRLNRITAISGTQAAVYLPGVTDNPPSTVTTCGSIPHAAILPLSATVPTRWSVINSRDLQSYMSWYKTIVGSPSADAEIQGNIYIRGSATELYAIEIDAVFVFRDSVPTGVTPAERGRIETLKEKERLLRILACPSPAPASTPGGLTPNSIGRF